MRQKHNVFFHEEQNFQQPRIRLLLAIPPTILLGLAVWQVALGHAWGKQPMSNGSLIFWTVFLWLLYFYLIRVRLVTEVRSDGVMVGLKGLGRRRSIPSDAIKSVELASYDPVRDFGGYGIRFQGSTSAYIASGNRGVRLELSTGKKVWIESKRPDDLLAALQRITGPALSRRDTQAESA